MTDWGSLSARASFASHRLIGWIYWDPIAKANYEALGIGDGVSYIVSRGAPLAPAGHQVLSAAYYSISPAFIEVSLSIAEQSTTYDAITAARNDAVARGLREFVPEICDRLAQLAEPMWAAADALPVSGRALFAAHRMQPRPTEDATLSSWLAVNCIREWRGDTHFAILAAEDISGTQAGLLHNAFLNYPDQWIPRSRGSDDAAIETALADLESRGLATDGTVNDAGLALRQRIEDRTDELCERAWRLLGEATTTDFLDLVEPIGDRLLDRIDNTAGTEWMPAARHRRD